MQANRDPIYRIYLLTIWQENYENETGVPLWRFRLEDPKTGHYQLFADHQALLEYMIQWTGGGPDMLR
jgi:hypothetical protein